MTISSPPDETGALVLEVGWPVPTGTRAVAPIEVRTLPPTAAIAHLHAGPYDELRGLYRGLYARAREAGYTRGAAPRERYLTAPGDGTPVTEVIWPIA
jgi:effector-binding domain-containing protein